MVANGARFEGFKGKGSDEGEGAGAAASINRKSGISKRHDMIHGLLGLLHAVLDVVSCVHLSMGSRVFRSWGYSHNWYQGRRWGMPGAAIGADN
jgi:hypothetical protein